MTIHYTVIVLPTDFWKSRSRKTLYVESIVLDRQVATTVATHVKFGGDRTSLNPYILTPYFIKICRDDVLPLGQGNTLRRAWKEINYRYTHDHTLSSLWIITSSLWCGSLVTLLLPFHNDKGQYIGGTMLMAGVRMGYKPPLAKIAP